MRAGEAAASVCAKRRTARTATGGGGRRRVCGRCRREQRQRQHRWKQQWRLAGEAEMRRRGATGAARRRESVGERMSTDMDDDENGVRPRCAAVLQRAGAQRQRCCIRCRARRSGRNGWAQAPCWTPATRRTCRQVTSDDVIVSMTSPGDRSRRGGWDGSDERGTIGGGCCSVCGAVGSAQLVGVGSRGDLP
jgi:hypothetical protein